MDPPSPSKLAMSPGMPIFPVSPERVTGTKPLYGEPVPLSPSAPNLRSYSPLRNSHRRNDSDVSVHGLATMFENLEVKDPREASKRFKEALEKEKTRNAEKLCKLEKEYAKKEKEHEMALGRRDIRIEELKHNLEDASKKLEVGVSRTQYEKERKDHNAAIAKWDKFVKDNQDTWRSTNAKLKESLTYITALEGKCREYKKRYVELHKKNLTDTSMIPTLQTKNMALQRSVQRAESDAKFRAEEATNFKNQVFSLEVEKEGISARLSEEVQTLKDQLRLIEAERDTLKTSLREEEIMRIASEGQIPLPTACAEENDEFGSPLRSPRKKHNFQQQEEDDKENVSPKKGAVDLRFLQQELATERRLRERAQEQVDFMKMECQFQCCSCRIAENVGKHYIHDDTYASEMQRIKMSVPTLTPPPSNHEENLMDSIIIKQEPVNNEISFVSPSEQLPVSEFEMDTTEQTCDNTVLVHSQAKDFEDVVTFSPSTGTFRSLPSPVKPTSAVVISTTVKPSRLAQAAVTEVITKSSSWTPDAYNMVISTEEISSALQSGTQVGSAQGNTKENKSIDISIHEDAIVDSEEEDFEPPTPSHEPSGPVTPYLTRTITTTTTIPLHFSPATPAFKPGHGPMTPSTVAHAPMNARTPVLGELALNKLPFDREAALEAIRQRRGRARSMAEGHGTPMKQMVEGIKDRRDISAPVSRVRR